MEPWYRRARWTRLRMRPGLPPNAHYPCMLTYFNCVKLHYNTSADINSVLVPIQNKQRYYISVESWTAVGKNSLKKLVSFKLYDYNVWSLLLYIIELEVGVVVETKLLASESAVLKLLVQLHRAPHLAVILCKCWLPMQLSTAPPVTIQQQTVHYHLAADANGKLVSVENLQFNTVYICNVSVFDRLYSHVALFATNNTLLLSLSE